MFLKQGACSPAFRPVPGASSGTAGHAPRQLPRRPRCFGHTSYDAEGNRITRTRISSASADDYLTTYTWDYRNRLTDVNFYDNSDTLTKHVHYTYDVFDHLIGKQVDSTGGGNYDSAEFYVYDGNDVALEFDASGNLTERYLSGPSPSGVDSIMAEEDVTSLTSAGTVSWPLVDNLGTVRDIVDSTGAVIDHLVYNSFGHVAYESNASVHHLLGYAGGISDADTGLVNFWHRWEDPAVGSWISEDPLEFAAKDPNLNRYVSDQVTSKIDPAGLDINNNPLYQLQEAIFGPLVDFLGIQQNSLFAAQQAFEAQKQAFIVCPMQPLIGQMQQLAAPVQQLFAQVVATPAEIGGMAAGMAIGASMGALGATVVVVGWAVLMGTPVGWAGGLTIAVGALGGYFIGSLTGAAAGSAAPNGPAGAWAAFTSLEVWALPFATGIAIGYAGNQFILPPGPPPF